MAEAVAPPPPAAPAPEAEAPAAPAPAPPAPPAADPAPAAPPPPAEAAVADAAPSAAAPAVEGAKRKILLRLDDGSLIGDSTILLNTSEGGAVLLEPQNAARVARAGQRELERLDRLLTVFRNKYPTAYLIPKSQIRNRNPYREEVRIPRSFSADDCLLQLSPPLQWALLPMQTAV